MNAGAGANVDWDDVSIVGAGAAGLYAAYRLARAHPDWRIGVYEQGATIGGRLCSRALGETGFAADLGAFSFSSADVHLAGLVAALDLAIEPVELNFERRLCRGVLMRVGESGAAPYRLDESERGEPAALLISAMIALAPELKAVFAAEPDRGYSWRAAHAYLSTQKIKNRALGDWGLRQILPLSAEACAYIGDGLGAHCLVQNDNALEALATFWREAWPGQTHFRFERGFQSFAHALRKACGQRTGLFLSHALRAAESEQEGLRLGFETPLGDRVIKTRRLVLALGADPIGALRFRDAAFGAALARQRTAVTPQAAARLFLEFENGFWPEPAISDKLQLSAAYTDLPLRQCWGFPQRGRTHLIMAAFADGAAARFWSNWADGQGAWRANSPGAPAPDHLIDAALDQLAQLYPEAQISRPLNSALADWSAAPFGAGWHSWRPGADAAALSQSLQRPDPNLPIFICGEAFSRRQGWVEGAINNAEMMLERHFGLGRPDWVAPDYAFEI